MQVLHTASWLRRLGIRMRVRAGMPRAEHFAWADLVHLFNTTNIHDTYAQMKVAQAAGKPFVLSTIYWNGAEYTFEHRTLFGRRWHLLRRALGRRLAFALSRLIAGEDRSVRQRRAELLQSAAMLLPNSEAERSLLIRDFRLPPDVRFIVVPNGVEDDDADDSYFQRRYAMRGFVLCAARIEDRKNQHALIEAIAPLRIPLVLIGLPNPDQISYLRLCQERARRLAADVTFILEHWNHRQLGSAYAAAKTHALVSWYDTPGLSSLEASVLGCSIVSTDRGPSREYFGDLAWYCDPSSVRSIREALVGAFYETGRNEERRARILARYCWKHAAELTALGYRETLRLLERPT